jgi:hypothetical protein
MAKLPALSNKVVQTSSETLVRGKLQAQYTNFSLGNLTCWTSVSPFGEQMSTDSHVLEPDGEFLKTARLAVNRVVFVARFRTRRRDKLCCPTLTDQKVRY